MTLKGFAAVCLEVIVYLTFVVWCVGVRKGGEGKRGVVRSCGSFL